MQPTPPQNPHHLAIFIISGGAGALGKHVVRVALSQFPELHSSVTVIPQVHTIEQVVCAVEQVAERRGVIVHTLVNPALRERLVLLAEERAIPTLDTIGGALAHLSMLSGHQPLGLPALYQGHRTAYQQRIEAIEYTVMHDDGCNTRGLHNADVVLTGVSRVGKTPLSMYLSVLGWKVANVPLTLEVPPPDELFTIDRRRVIGLVIEVDSLLHHRRWRQRRWQGLGCETYSDTEYLYEELQAARKVFCKGRFAVIDVTNKPIEESADQVIALINRYFEHKVLDLAP